MLGPLFNRFSFTRRKKAPSPFAGYNERMMSAAVDLFCALIVLRPVLNFLDARIAPHVHRAAVEGGLTDIVEKAQHLDAGTQFSMLIHAIFASDVWWWVIINHGSAFLVLASALALMQYFTRTTPGKWLMGIKLTVEDQFTPPSLMRIIVRYLVCLPSCAFFMLGMVWIMFDKKSRSLHDIVAGTYVMNMRPHGWYWTRIKRGYHHVRGWLGIKAPVQAPSAADEPVAEPTTDQR